MSAGEAALAVAGGRLQRWIPASAGIHLAGEAERINDASMPKTFCVYMLASKPNGTLYVGVTSNLAARLWQHRHHVTKGFSDRYEVTRLVWYEVHDSAEFAIAREKQLKKWRRRGRCNS